MADGVKGAFSLNLSQNICKPELVCVCVHPKEEPIILDHCVFYLVARFLFRRLVCSFREMLQIKGNRYTISSLSYMLL